MTDKPFDLYGWIREIRDCDAPVVPANDCDPMAVMAGISPEVRRITLYVVDHRLQLPNKETS